MTGAGKTLEEYKGLDYVDAVTIITKEGIPYSILGDIQNGITTPKGCKIVSFYNKGIYSR